VKFQLALFALCAAACSSGGASGSPYTIAAAGPWQLSHGLNTRLGIALAVKQVNDAGGVRGHKLQIKDADDKADGATAAQIAQQFVDDKTISAVVGHVTSGAMVAAAQVYDGHLTAVATSASSPDLTGISKWVFRVISSDSANGADMARFATRTGHKRAAILCEPGMLFVGGVMGAELPILSEAKKQVFKSDFLGGDGGGPITAHPEISEGAYVGSPFAPTDPRPEAQKFVAAFKAANGGAEPDGNAALGYDATKVIVSALAAVGPDRERIRDWLANLPKPYAGVTGPIQFLPTGDPAGKSITMTRVRRDGTLTVVGSSK
jgi:branched-chain amino acid transport system substrate-binding protein